MCFSNLLCTLNFKVYFMSLNGYKLSLCNFVTKVIFFFFVNIFEQRVHFSCNTSVSSKKYVYVSSTRYTGEINNFKIKNPWTYVWEHVMINSQSFVYILLFHKFFVHFSHMPRNVKKMSCVLRRQRILPAETILGTLLLHLK